MHSVYKYSKSEEKNRKSVHLFGPKTRTKDNGKSSHKGGRKKSGDSLVYIHP